MKRIFTLTAASTVVLGVVLVGNALLSAAEPFYKPAKPLASTIPSEWTSNNNDEIVSIPGKDGAEATSALRIVGNGETTQWLSKPVAFESRKGYRLRFNASSIQTGGDGLLCSGVEFFNIDTIGIKAGEVPSQRITEVFMAPDGPDGVATSAVRFAQWHSRREFRVSMPELSVVSPVYKQIESTAPQKENVVTALPLGYGEEIREDGLYTFTAFQSRENSDFDRPLESLSCTFNSDRFGFGKNQTLTYEFAFTPYELHKNAAGSSVTPLAAIPIVDGSVFVTVGYYVGGKMVVEASVDGSAWTKLGEIVGKGAEEYSLAPVLDGGKQDAVFVRMRSEENEPGESVSLQIHSFSAKMKLAQSEANPFVGIGETIYADLANEDNSDAPMDATPWIYNDDGVWTVPNEKSQSAFLGWNSPMLPKDEKAEPDPDALVPKVAYVANFRRAARIERSVYPYFIQNFTRKVPGSRSADDVDVSWCDADYQVPRNPKEYELLDAAPVELYSARNDYESFQIVLRPRKNNLTGVTAVLDGDLIAGDNARIAKGAVQIRYAYYHNVTMPTDRSCAAGYYPDALIPMEKGADGFGAPIVVKADENLPIWVTVKTPDEASAGQYKGTVRVTANDGEFAVDVPFVVNVWSWKLPVKNHHETAFGMAPHFIWRYHNCKTEEDKRAVLEMYLKAYGDYRISPYNPAPMDSIKVTWRTDTNPPSCELDFDAFDKEMKRVFDKYHFTNFLLSVQGLGGGTFDYRYDGSVEGFKSGTPEYEAMMSDYGSKLQEHLREVGFLDAAYTYNFDEPEEKDYEFVAGELAKLRKYMPDVNRMLTEEPSPKFEEVLKNSDASINIWCPISDCYSDDSSVTQRKEGNRFWWYVCTGPKAPFCTEFTDHPLQELRIWHWQAFERDIVGSLIWEATYWTSETAFGKDAQNPYLDPMCYMTGGGLAPGTKKPWGNGDGRFIYPPLSAAVPGMNDGKPVFDEPNVSARWEMLRAGIQDIEMLRILKTLLDSKGAELSADRRAEIEKLLDFDSITTDATHFSKDPQVLLERRKAIGNAIEALK